MLHAIARAREVEAAEATASAIKDQAATLQLQAEALARVEEKLDRLLALHEEAGVSARSRGPKGGS